MPNFEKIVIDHEPLNDITGVKENDTEVLIRKDLVEKGDRINLVYDQIINEYNEVVFLSVDNKNLYKNLALETEIEFKRNADEVSKNFELIFRAINRWDKTYTVDEYYTVGVQDSYFYIAKVTLHEESNDSYSYKVLLDIGGDNENFPIYTKQFSEDDKKVLFLDDEDFRYEDKYIFRIDVVDEKVSLRVRNTSTVEAIETRYKWVTVFDSINLNQTKEKTSSRNSNLDIVLAAPEPLTYIGSKGLYGFSVPNSFVNIYRIEVTPFDDDLEMKLFNDIDYSKNVSTEFSRFYKTKTPLKMNSNGTKNEIRSVFKEYIDIEDNYVILDDNVKEYDIERVQVNKINQERDINYEDRFVDIEVPLDDNHNGSIIRGLIQDDDEGNYGEHEKYFRNEKKTNGVESEFEISEEMGHILKYYPNSKLGDVLIELIDEPIQNSFELVGLAEDLNRFITQNIIEEEYAGRSFFMETVFRGQPRFFELGAIGNGRISYGIEKYFRSPNDSYGAIWRYNLADFIDELTSVFATIGVETITTGSSNTQNVSNKSLFSADFSKYSISKGYAIASLSFEDVKILSRKTTIDIDSSFDPSDLNVDTDVRLMIDNGAKVEVIKVVLDMFQTLNFPDFKDIFVVSHLYDNSYEVQIKKIYKIYGGDFNRYTLFRQVWLEGLPYNSHTDLNGLPDRKFYVNIPEVTYDVDLDDLKIVFNEKPLSGRSLVYRVFYENIITLTDNYRTDDTHYFVGENIKSLYEETNTEKGVVDLLEYYDPAKFGLMVQDSVPFVALPKNLNENDGPIYASVEVCGPFIEATQNVRRVFKLPLRKVKQFLDNDFESSIYGEIFPYTTEYYNNDNFSFGDEADPLFSTDSFSEDIDEYILSAVNNNGTPPVFVDEDGDAKIIQSNVTFNNKPMISRLINVKPYTDYKFDYNIVGSTAQVFFRAGDVLGSGFFETSSKNGRFNSGNNTSVYVGVYVNDTRATNGYVGAYFIISDFSVTPVNTTGGWNREYDYMDLDKEFLSGGTEPYTYNFPFPRVYPVPDGNTNFLPVGASEPDLNDTFMENVLNGIVPRTVIDKYLNVYRWFNVENSQLTPYYKRVLLSIIKLKSNNRYYGKKVNIDSNADPFNLGNWFDGFYSGAVSAWVTYENGNELFDFGKYNGHPWGEENSRTQMIRQLRNTINGKFPKYELYYVDLSPIYEYRFDESKGLNGAYIDLTKYPLETTKDHFINNPQDDPRLKYYEMNETIVISGGNQIEQVFKNDSLVGFTDTVFEYPEIGNNAYGNLNRGSVDVVDIVRPINNGVDMYWNFDSSIMFSSKQNNILPRNTEVNAEYEYERKSSVKEDNSPPRIIQKVNLGRATGDDFQKFYNPNVKFANGIESSNVHRVWLDNYEITNFDVFNLGNNAKLALNLPEEFKDTTEKEVSVKYKASNYFDINAENVFIDDFNKKRDFIWMNLTRTDEGYLKKETFFDGYIVDSDKLPKDYVFRLDDITESKIITTGTTKSSNVVKPISIGKEDEDVVAITSIRRNNNFVLECDIYYDEEIERQFMKTDFIFRGKFNVFNKRQYFNEYYAITLGLENSSIALTSRRFNDKNVKEEQLLASVEDENTVIKRGVYYTLKMRVVSDELIVFFNERNQEEKFFFSYNLREGHDKTGLEAVAEKRFNGLNISYEDPEFYIDGDRLGIKARHQGVNFMNYKIRTLEESTITLENGFVIKSYDDIVAKLKKDYSLSSGVKKFNRTNDGYEYMQIGSSLFYRRNDGVFTNHRMVVEDFEIIDNKVYVRERIKDESTFNVINVYEKEMKLLNSIVVDGKQFINEPIFSYLADTQRVVTQIEEIDGRLFIVTEGSSYFVQTWTGYGEAVWIEVQAPWNLYG
jgi:hypothetical protein